MSSADEGDPGDREDVARGGLGHGGWTLSHRGEEPNRSAPVKRSSQRRRVELFACPCHGTAAHEAIAGRSRSSWARRRSARAWPLRSPRWPEGSAAAVPRWAGAATAQGRRADGAVTGGAIGAVAGVDGAAPCAEQKADGHPAPDQAKGDEEPEHGHRSQRAVLGRRGGPVARRPRRGGDRRARRRLARGRRPGPVVQRRQERRDLRARRRRLGRRGAARGSPGRRPRARCSRPHRGGARSAGRPRSRSSRRRRARR